MGVKTNWPRNSNAKEPSSRLMPLTISCSVMDPTGPTITPLGFSWSRSSFGNSLQAAVIIILS